MPLVHCSYHGCGGGELVTQAVRHLVNDRQSWRDDDGVVPLTLVRDEIEYPGFMLDSGEGISPIWAARTRMVMFIASATTNRWRRRSVY